jgi:hypothetical protein
MVGEKKMKKKIKDATHRVVGRQDLVLNPETKWETKFELILLDNDNIFIPVRPFIDALGLNWSGLRRKILRQSYCLKPIHISSVAKDGKRRRMLCIILDELTNFLESINLDKCKDNMILNVMEFYIDFASNDLQSMAEDKETFYRNLQKEGLSKIQFLGRPKGDHDVFPIEFAELGFSLIHRKPVEDIHELFEGARIRYAPNNGENWYAGKDICKLLELTNYRTVLERVSDRNKKLLPIKTTGGSQKMICINIEGLIEIVKTCRKPYAKYGLEKYLDL